MAFPPLIKHILEHGDRFAVKKTFAASDVGRMNHIRSCPSVSRTENDDDCPDVKSRTFSSGGGSCPTNSLSLSILLSSCKYRGFLYLAKGPVFKDVQ